MVSAILEAKKVSRILSGASTVTLVDKVDFKVFPNEFISICGASGSGKSSLLYLMGLLDIPTSGDVVIDGVSSRGLSEEKKADLRLSHIGFVFQFHFLLQEFSVLENVTLPMKRLGKRNAEEMNEKGVSLLKSLGLEKEIYKNPKQLSGGQSQRVAVARALANDPLVLLADEPTGNLDSKSSLNVQDILKEISKDHGRSVVAVTHDREFAERADRIVTVVDGRISN